MSAAVLLAAMAVLGVDYGWRKSADGQTEYIIQIRPEQLALMRDHPISSELPPHLHNVRRFVIQVGSGPLPREDPTPPLLAPPSAPKQSLPRAPQPDPLSTGSPSIGSPPTEIVRGQSFGTFRGGGNSTRIAHPPSFDRTTTAPGSNFDTRQIGTRSAAGGQPSLHGQMTSVAPSTAAAPSAAPQNGSAGQSPFGRGGPPPRVRITAAGAGVRPKHAYSNRVQGQAARSGFARQASHEEEIKSGGSWAEEESEDQSSVRRKKTDPNTEKPWAPLALTTLLLFASIGGNAYLGWIAWGFHRRALALTTRLRRTESN